MKSSANVGTILPVRCNCTRIRRAARKVTRFYDACLAPVGVTASQFTLLAYLKHQGPMRMSQLAELLAMDRTTLGHNLRPLERDGLLEIIPSKEDRRARLVAIIAAGLHRIKQGRPLWDQAQCAFERAFGTSKAAEMRRMMDAAADVPLDRAGLTALGARSTQVRDRLRHQGEASELRSALGGVLEAGLDPWAE
jgi:DNA-binding MarR family transcriptional regulator